MQLQFAWIGRYGSCLKSELKSGRSAMRRGRAVQQLGALGGSVLCLLALSADAFAMDTGKLSHDRMPELSLTLVGRVDDRCSLSGGGVLALGELTSNKTIGADFSLDCNVPFEIAISTANGGLAHQTKPEGEGTFTGHLEYDVMLRVPVIGPIPSTLSGSFASSDLLGRRVIDSGNAIAATSRGQLSLTTRAAGGSGLLAGSYEDFITISVAPKF